MRSFIFSDRNYYHLYEEIIYKRIINLMRIHLKRSKNTEWKI